MKTNVADYKDRIFCCDHVEEGEEEHVFIWAGAHTRIKLCKFCCAVAVGTITQRTISDAARARKGISEEEFFEYARGT